MTSLPAYTIGKVQKRSTEMQAADTLRDAIISGGIPLGTRLTELAVADQLGVSRGTIRTAFHQLTQEGLVVQVPYTGWHVMTLSAQDAWELYTLRGSLEALAARLTAERVKGEGEAATVLTLAFDRLRAACDGGGKLDIAVADMGLHKTIVDLAGHRRLVDQYSMIQNQVMIYIQSSDALIAQPEQIIAQHDPLMAALLAGDGIRAASEAATHNETEGKVLVDYLDQHRA